MVPFEQSAAEACNRLIAKHAGAIGPLGDPDERIRILTTGVRKGWLRYPRSDDTPEAVMRRGSELQDLVDRGLAGDDPENVAAALRAGLAWAQSAGCDKLRSRRATAVLYANCGAAAFEIEGVQATQSAVASMQGIPSSTFSSLVKAARKVLLSGTSKTSRLRMESGTGGTAEEKPERAADVVADESAE